MKKTDALADGTTPLVINPAEVSAEDYYIYRSVASLKAPFSSSTGREMYRHTKKGRNYPGYELRGVCGFIFPLAHDYE